METRPVLNHLILVTHSGMGNRLRAIASARRLCQQINARCSIVWEWGDFWSFFAPLPDLRVFPKVPEKAGSRIKHQPLHVNPSRTVDISVPSVELHSSYIFWGSHEQVIHIKQLLPYLPALHPRLQAMVDEFTAKHLGNSVGLHLRRTDQTKSIRHSPDRLFIEKAREIVASGKKIFLATDNVETEAKMKQLFGDAIVTYPKRTALKQRWPREGFDPIVVEDDLIDLFLLSRTGYVLGSHFSSFSSLAIALNGSKQGGILRDPNAEAVVHPLSVGSRLLRWLNFSGRPAAKKTLDA